ncbi:MAG: hypothetical protein QOG11_569 [Solirubrobacteraceae bacterium]|jgi:hypothetical protein|nr:hypothetical protein [Solirubrobacteraceae bacterium]
MEHAAGGTFLRWLPGPRLLLLAYVVADAATYAFAALPGGVPWTGGQLFWILIDLWLVSLMLRESYAALGWSLALAIGVVVTAIAGEVFLPPQPGFAAVVVLGAAQVAPLAALYVTGLPERRRPPWPTARRRAVNWLVALALFAPVPWSQSTVDARGCVDHQQGVAPAPLTIVHAVGAGTPGFSYSGRGSFRCN